jgi:hypothetical protein
LPPPFLKDGIRSKKLVFLENRFFTFSSGYGKCTEQVWQDFAGIGKNVIKRVEMAERVGFEPT